MIDDQMQAAFAATILVTWDDLGLPVTLSGPGAARPEWGTAHVVTAWNPGGEDASAQQNGEAHRRLVARADAEGWAWEPVVGASPDGRHHELGIATPDLSRGKAVALGRELDQLAVFELDDDEQRIVACDGSPLVAVERARPFAEMTITFDQVIAWRTEHEESTGHRLPRVRCPRCDAADPARILYGMPARVPPDWHAVGGCMVMTAGPHLRCRSRGECW